MARRNRRTSSGSSNPGLTPIDDANAGTMRTNLDPDRTTGRLPGQDDDMENKEKEHRSSKKKNRR